MPTSPLQIKISLCQSRDPDLYAYFMSLPAGSRAAFLRLALQRAVSAGLVPHLGAPVQVDPAADARPQPVHFGASSPRSESSHSRSSRTAHRGAGVVLHEQGLADGAVSARGQHAAAAPESGSPEMAEHIARMQRLNRFG